MTSGTIKTLAIMGLVAACPVASTLAQSTMSTGSTMMPAMSGPREGNAAVEKATSRNLSPNGTGGSNGIAIGSRGAATGTNLRQPAAPAAGVDPAPTVPATTAGAPPPPTVRAPR